jgi:hypothetical protein
MSPLGIGEIEDRVDIVRQVRSMRVHFGFGLGRLVLGDEVGDNAVPGVAADNRCLARGHQEHADNSNAACTST